MDLAAKQDYPAFYEVEIAARKLMKYPPFADIGMFGFVGTDEKTVKAASVRFLEQLRRTVAQDEYADLPLIALDPTPASVVRVAGKYRYKLIVKLTNNKRTRSFIAQLLTQFSALPENKGVTVYADINPATIL